VDEPLTLAGPRPQAAVQPLNGKAAGPLIIHHLTRNILYIG
jgi:hypothetical protein